MYQVQGIIKENLQVAEQLFKMKIYCPEVSVKAKPGQFIHLKITPGNEPFLRRPMSIMAVDKSVLTILYQVVGLGTDILKTLKVEQSLNILGPLGQGFVYEPNDQQVLMAGGIGVAPLIFLAQSFNQHQISCSLYLGSKKGELSFIKDYLPPTVSIFTAQENAEPPEYTLVTDYLTTIINKDITHSFYCCGPAQMYQTIYNQTRLKPNLKVQIALDQHMACGVGTCLGCTVPLKKKNRQQKVNVRACVEGPVFYLEEVFDNYD